MSKLAWDWLARSAIAQSKHTTQTPCESRVFFIIKYQKFIHTHLDKTRGVIYYIPRTQRDLGAAKASRNDVNLEKSNRRPTKCQLWSNTASAVKKTGFDSQTQHGGWLPPTSIV